MQKALADSPWNRLEIKKDAKLGIIASGVASIYAEEAMETLGTNVSYLKIGAYPIDPSFITQLADNVERILVIEELTPFIEEQVRMYAPKVMGKMTGEVPNEGEFDPMLVSNIIRKAAGQPLLNNKEVKLDFELPARSARHVSRLPAQGDFLCAKKRVQG